MKRALVFIFLLALVPCNAVLAITSASKEFTSGKFTKFSTAGHPKSNGVNMAISYPNSWMAMEGERPHIVQKFVSEGGQGLEIATITMLPLPLPKGVVIPENELRAYFTPTAMKNMTPPGATFISAKSTMIEGVPAGILRYSMRQDRAGRTVESQWVSYYFIYKATAVTFGGSVALAQPFSPDALSKKMDDFASLFFLMANSIVLPEQY